LTRLVLHAEHFAMRIIVCLFFWYRFRGHQLSTEQTRPLVLHNNTLIIQTERCVGETLEITTDITVLMSKTETEITESISTKINVKLRLKSLTDPLCLQVTRLFTWPPSLATRPLWRTSSPKDKTSTPATLMEWRRWCGHASESSGLQPTHLHTHTHTPVQQPFGRDYPGEPVPER